MIPATLSLERRQLLLPVVVGVVAGVVALDPPFAVVAGIAVGFALLTSLRTKVVIYFVLLPIVWFFKFRFPTTSVQAVPDLISLALLIQIGWEIATKRLRLPARNVLFLLTVGYALIVFVQAFNPVIFPTGEGIPGARVYLEPFVLFIAGVHYFKNGDDARLFLKVVLVMSLVVGLYMLWQVIVGYSAAEQAALSSRFVFTRTLAEKKIFSTLPSPDVFGFVASLFLLAAISARAAGVWPRYAAAMAGLSAIGAVVSGLRIAVIGSLVAGLLLLVVQLREDESRRSAFRALTVGIAASVVLGSAIIASPARTRADSVRATNAVDAAIVKLALLKQGSSEEDFESRQERTGEFLDFLSRRPWGTGPGIVRLVDAFTDAPGGRRPDLPKFLLVEPWIFQHDFYYFAVGVELGLLPMIWYVAVLLLGIVLGYRTYRSNTDAAVRAILALAVAAFALTLVHNLTNEAFRTPQVAAYVWFLLSAPVAYAGSGGAWHVVRMESLRTSRA